MKSVVAPGRLSKSDLPIIALLQNTLQFRHPCAGALAIGESVLHDLR